MVDSSSGVGAASVRTSIFVSFNERRLSQPVAGPYRFDPSLSTIVDQLNVDDRDLIGQGNCSMRMRIDLGSDTLEQRCRSTGPRPATTFWCVS